MEQNLGAGCVLSACFLATIGAPFGLVGLGMFNESQERMKRMEVEAKPVVREITAAEAYIDRDGLTDLVLKVNDETVILLANKANGCIRYLPIKSSDIYRIK